MYGFLRETQEIADKSGLDPTGICRTGLDTYLAKIFPDVDDWIHDKSMKEYGIRTRPDYRSETLKLIVEVDGLPHYDNPENIIKDIQKTEAYKKVGFNVVRIPYFIQLSRDVVKKYFNVDVGEELFDESYPSMGVELKNTPAFLCPLGIDRMKKGFEISPKQLDVNLKALENGDDRLTGYSLLKG